jgi:hypothetical protein
LGRWLGLGPRLGLGRLGLRHRMAVLGRLLGARLESLVVRPLLVCPVGVHLSGLQLRLVRRSAAIPSGFVAGFVAGFVVKLQLAGKLHERAKLELQFEIR